MPQRSEDIRFHDVNDLAIAVAVLGPDLQILHANTHLSRLLDLPVARIEGRQFEHLVALEALEASSWRDLLKGATKRLQSVAFLRKQANQVGSPALLVTMTKSSQGDMLLAQVQGQVAMGDGHHIVGADASHNPEVVASYMTSLLPNGLHCASGVRIQSCYLPSAKLAGDWFDYFWITDQQLLIYLVDVSGHPPASALQAVSLHNLFKSCALGKELMLDPAETLSRLNTLFPIERQLNYFSIWYGLYDVASRTLRFSTGGHPPALMMSEAPLDGSRRNGQALSVRKLSTNGIGVGLLERADYQNEFIDVSHRDRLLVFSDGLFEFFDRNGRIWSYESLLQYVEVHGRAINVDTLTGQLMGQSGAGRFRDDCSVVLIDFEFDQAESLE